MSIVKDHDAKRERGYTNRKSFVRAEDGSEVLFKEDWLKRKLELWKRSEGRCEHTWEAGSKTYRCPAEGVFPCHVIPRHPRRDDRMENLLNLCFTHSQLPEHERQAWRKTRFGEHNSEKPFRKRSR